MSTLREEFETTRRDAEDDLIYADCTIEYTVSGSYRLATRIDPEEWPEIEIESITAALGDGNKTALDFDTDFSEKEQGNILGRLAEHHQAEQYDPAWDGPEYDD